MSNGTRNWRTLGGLSAGRARLCGALCIFHSTIVVGVETIVYTGEFFNAACSGFFKESFRSIVCSHWWVDVDRWSFFFSFECVCVLWTASRAVQLIVGPTTIVSYLRINPRPWSASCAGSMPVFGLLRRRDSLRVYYSLSRFEI